jgi:hypothetical protein
MEFGSGKSEWGIEKNAEVGLRPVGGIGAYAPEGMRNVEKGNGNRKECGSGKAERRRMNFECRRQ